jgi:hypothetical protein
LSRDALFVRSIALDKSLYKSVEISSFLKINIIGGNFCLIVWLLVVNADILDFEGKRVRANGIVAEQKATAV